MANNSISVRVRRGRVALVIDTVIQKVSPENIKISRCRLSAWSTNCESGLQRLRKCPHTSGQLSRRSCGSGAVSFPVVQAVR